MPPTAPIPTPDANAVGALLRRRREGRGWTLAGLAIRVGSTKGYLSMIENGRVANPPSRRLLEALEAALGIDDGALVAAADWARAPEPVRAEAQRGREVMQLLEDARRRGVSLDELFASGRLADAVNAAAPAPPAATVEARAPEAVSRRVPLINKVAAGYPQGFTDLDYPARVADDYVAALGIDDPDAFAATVCGDSMLPEYREGDVIVFSPNAAVSDGDDCFVRIEPDHETTFKRVFFDEERQTIRLAPLNPKFESHVLPRTQVAGLYRAAARYSKL